MNRSILNSVFPQGIPTSNLPLDREIERAYIHHNLPFSINNFPTDHPRSPSQTFSPASLSFELSQPLTQQLQLFSKQVNTALGTILLSAFKILLLRYTNYDEIVIGFPIFWQENQDNGHQISSHPRDLHKILFLETSVDAHSSFIPFTKSVQESIKNAYSDQVFFGSNLSSDIANLFPQITFIFESFEEFANVLSETSELQLILASGETHILGEIRYNSSLFEVATIQRMIGHFITLLEGILGEPATPICHLPILPENERNQLLFNWNHTQVEYPSHLCLHEIFEQQVEQNPEIIAVKFEGEELTYRELNEKATQLAAYLQSLGVQPDVLVGLCVERSVEMIVGILGILKVGGAYVPVDPIYPSERIKFMLEDANISILLTQQHLLENLPKTVDQIICLDQEVSQVSFVFSPSSVSPQNLAYVIYTSGSTGTPKGVCCHHTGVINLMEEFQRRQPIEAGDHCSLWTVSSFDASVQEIFSALLFGGTLYIVPDAIRSDTHAFIQWLKDCEIHSAFILPFMISELAKWLENPENSLPLKRLSVGVEPIYEPLLVAIAEQLPAVKIVNGYGPTEATICSTLYSVNSQNKLERNTPIGKPVQNTQIYILDAYLQPVPIGIPGEIYIGGVGVTKGYLNRPELTAERFISNPFVEDGGLGSWGVGEIEELSSHSSLVTRHSSLLYKTGDLAKYLPDGNIEYLNRIDQQVKIRGFRIELGEIEAVLNQHSTVESSIVVARNESSGNQQLVGYIVAKYDEDLDEISLPAEQMNQWQTLYDETYHQITLDQDPKNNFSNWNSSYTGLPIPQAEMVEWAEETKNRILSLHPQNILEVGCGTGLILLRVSPHCRHYHGSDFSAEAIAFLQQYFTQSSTTNVTLSQQTAENLSEIELDEVDTIIINSVIQYFPSLTYLLQVIEQATCKIQSSGQIFIGDVRSLPLLESYHASIEQFKADASFSKQQLQQRVQAQVANEEELVIDPRFFYALPQAFPQISHVEVQLKRGNAENELTKFRYDVILYVNQPPKVISEINWIDWQTENLTVPALREKLIQEQPEILAIAKIINTRLVSEIQLVKWLESETAETFEDFQKQHSISGISPQQLGNLADERGYKLYLTECPDFPGYFNAAFVQQNSDFVYQPVSNLSSTLNQYINNPLKAKLTRQLIPILRSYLQAKLPHYMIPNTFVLLDQLPLTPNGKIDRKALPAPEYHLNELDQQFVAPRTLVEQQLAQIWSEVLGLPKISIHDTFLELGGHSLLATQLLSRIRSQFQVELPLRVLFEAPTIATLATRIQQIQNEQKLEIVALTPIPKIDPNQPIPLSYGQQQIWFLSQLEADLPLYNQPFTIRIPGKLDVIALENSLNEIIHRHEILRTTFEVIDGEPVQVVQPELKLKLTLVDLQHLPAELRETEVIRLATLETCQPFNLHTGPLLRVTPYQLGEEDFRIFLTMHHIISDGYSVYTVFLKELVALYNLETGDQPVSLENLPDLPVQYAAFSVWQRQWLQGEWLEPHRQYWQQQLADLPTLQLPTDHPRPPIPSYRGARQRFTLSKALTEALKTLARQEGVTLFMTLLAAFKTLLARYSGQEDIVLGTATAGRSRPEIENLFGFFLNMLVLRTNLAGDPSFRELLGRVREMMLATQAHEVYPFDELLHLLGRSRNLSQNPLFQVLFVLEPAANHLNAGWTLSQLEVDTGTAKFDLYLELDETPEGLVGRVEYSTDLFEAATITRMIGHFQTLLAGIIANPHQLLSQLPILTEAERYQLLVEWNNTHLDYPQDACVHQLFEAQVERTPDAVAVIFERDTLTYRQLNTYANQVAHYLRSQGVQTETLVGVCMDRSFEMIIGLMGILKAGGAYVPLDPAYPAERLALILQDTQLGMILTQERHQDKLRQSSQTAQLLCLDAGWEMFAGNPEHNPESEVTLDNLAYVMYTSGSTGTPKGVLALHRCPVNRFYGEIFPLEPHEICCQKTSLNFVDSIWEIFKPLMHGLPTVIIPNDILRDPPQLIHTLAKHQVTRIMLVPSLLRVLLDVEPNLQSRLPHLKYWFCGGEALSTELAERFLHQMPNAILLNLYGLSELWDVTWYDIRNLPTQPHIAAGAFVPNGRPIPNVQVYLLDAHQQPVPVGVIGEIYVGGDGISRGYLNRPELTAERFIAFRDAGEMGRWGDGEETIITNYQLPISNYPIYKTGDLGRYRSDGTIEYLGRIDHQVKIRGFRIEAGEIELLLAQHPQVRQAVVVTREDQAGNLRLVAYIIPQNQQKIEDLNKTNLREFLLEKLPDYMVPSAFVILEKLPLTPSGKVNRLALPAPEFELSTSTFVAPRNSLETQIQAIWEDILGVKPIGVKDNFFELGGHSLLAVRLFAQLEKTFQKHIPLSILFQASTIEKLAEFLCTTDQALCPNSANLANNISLVPLQPNGDKKPLYVVHTVGGHLMRYNDLLKYIPKDQPVYGLQSAGLNGITKPYQTVEEMAAHYIKEIQTFQPEGPYLLGGSSFGGMVAFEMAQQLVAKGEKVDLLVLLDTQVGQTNEAEISKLTTQGNLVNKGASHLRNLSQLSRRQQINYILDWLKSRSISRLQGIIWTFKMFACRLYERLEKPLPPALREFRVLQANLAAHKRYKPQVYPGRITLFRAGDETENLIKNPLLGWEGLATEGIEIHDIPGHHTTIVFEPRVAVLAEKLNELLIANHA
jgi:amino acid adenylation domain-containing protein